MSLSAILFSFHIGGQGGLQVCGSDYAHVSVRAGVCSSGPGVGQIKGNPEYHPPLWLCSGSAPHPFILCHPCPPPPLLWWKQQEEWKKKKTQDSYFIQPDCVCYLGNQVIGYGWRWQEMANSSEKTLQFSNLPPSRCLAWVPSFRIPVQQSK